jgi:hypothetical protein
LDCDVVQPGNSLRWPLGRPAWGIRKAEALANFVAQNYPWTKPVPYHGKLGATATDVEHLPAEFRNGPGALLSILKIIDEVDLVIDTSASSEVQQALAYYCRTRGKPYIMGYATLGLAGGVVARFAPRSPSCLVCLHEHWKEGTIPTPRVNEAGVVTPVGCNAPTFTGGGFDLEEVSLEVVRSAIGMLTEAYDPGAWQVAILELRDGEGRRALPRWAAHDCPPHPRCCGSVT